MNEFQWNYNRNSYLFILENAFKNVVCKMVSILSRPQCIDTMLLMAWLLVSPVHHQVCIKSLWPSDGVWWPRSGSTLVQVKACCLMAPSHYPNQSWLIINKASCHLSEGNFAENVLPGITYNRMAWQWAETLVEIRGTLVDIRGTTK